MFNELETRHYVYSYLDNIKEDIMDYAKAKETLLAKALEILDLDISYKINSQYNNDSKENFPSLFDDIKNILKNKYANNDVLINIGLSYFIYNLVLTNSDEYQELLSVMSLGNYTSIIDISRIVDLSKISIKENHDILVICSSCIRYLIEKFGLDTLISYLVSNKEFSDFFKCKYQELEKEMLYSIYNVD